MTLWEASFRPERRRVLRLLCGGYTVLALGCLAVTGRAYWPGVSGAALSNLVIMSGYLLILDGVAALGGRHHRLASLGALAVIGMVWAIGGPRWEDTIWIYVSALPVALVSGATGWELLRNDQLRSLRSRRVVIAVTGFYALLYAGRALALPVLAAMFGRPIVAMASNLTMYAGVLYSVMLPMGLLALIREEAQERLLRLALTDDLTELGNRRWFFEQGRRLILSPRRAMSLLAFDLDHFKSINDQYGHAAGDDVLKAFAAILRDAAGPSAILARVGGEEFAAILPECGRDQARWIGQAVVQRFADTSVLSGSGIAVHTTVSVGLAEAGTQDVDLARLLGEADRALYAAKALGRNRIEQSLAVA